MIEAVNSVVSSASLLRQSTQQAEVARAASETESVSTFPLAPYIDQIAVDTNFDTAVLRVRDSDTGDVLSQFPSETTLEARQRAEAVRQRAELLRQGSSGSDVSSGSVQAPQGQSFQSVNVQAAAIANQSAQQSLGAGEAQVAIAALSTGAQSGQASSANVSVTA